MNDPYAEQTVIYQGDRVKKVGGDYVFVGTVVGIITKRNGKVRYVIENDDGILHIFSHAQLVSTEVPQHEHLKGGDEQA